MAQVTRTDGVDSDELDDLWQPRSRISPASDAVYATLREAILSGVLQPGTRLAEGELAGRFDVSRTPVREAVLRLEAELLAERVARRGLVVATITPAEILDLYVVRQAVDSHAAYLAAANASPPEIQRLRAIHVRMVEAQAAGDVATMSRLNLQFHESICLAGHSRLLLRFMQEVHNRVRRFTSSTFAQADRARQALEEHDQLIEAIEARDPDRAHDLAHAHMGRALEVRIRMQDNEDR